MIEMFPAASPAPAAVTAADDDVASGGDGAQGSTPQASSDTPWLQTKVHKHASHCIHRSLRKLYVADLKLVINSAAAGRNWNAQTAFEQGVHDHGISNNDRSH